MHEMGEVFGEYRQVPYIANITNIIYSSFGNEIWLRI